MFQLLLILLLNLPAYAENEKEPFIEKMARYHSFVDAIIRGSLDSRGMSLDALFRPNLNSWPSIASTIDLQVQTGACQSTDCPDYEEDFARVAESALGYSRFLEKLDNKRSFQLRNELFKQAKKSIFVLVWAIYDDETGHEFFETLIEKIKRNPEMDIRIIVDGNMSNMIGRRVLRRIDKESKGKIQILKWRSRKYRANGNHRKMIIVDQEHVIVGGMNIGNNYSHVGQDEKWRDLDVYSKGVNAGTMAYNQFAEVWNDQIDEHRRLRSLEKMTIEDVPQKSMGVPVVFVDQHPGSAKTKAYHNIHTGLVKLLRDAQTSIDIENAYFIMDPIVKSEIQSAINRGVKVRIFTNSDKSVDEKIVSMPIMHSAREAFLMGAEVYLREGTTLHSKYMVIDSKISMVGSFNLHPRSLRFDAENVAVIFDAPFAESMTQHFEKGLNETVKYTRVDQFRVDWNFIGLITSSIYFDFL